MSYGYYSYFIIPQKLGRKRYYLFLLISAKCKIINANVLCNFCLIWCHSQLRVVCRHCLPVLMVVAGHIVTVV